ncbi:MAG: LLM class F420-dependent oxidoreductase [Promicromonosporaceae bacterium]|nr:LLM class F420-dependent oxidoreductase [Promicromonosporaceae bacterium]
MRFGMFIPQGWRLDLTETEPAGQWAAMKSLLAMADANSAWESVWVYDHFHTVPAPTDQATHEAWTLMAAFAAASGRVRLGQMCTCMAYREPTYLAKVAATVDVISGGRAEMGIGAGWYEHEWRAYGYGFPRAGERLAMLDEGVQIMASMWRTGTSGRFEGKHYDVDGALCHPQPLQAVAVDGAEVPSIPLWIAGGGEKKTLLTAAKYAQYTNFDGSPAGFAHKSAVLKAHCQDVGRDFAEITRSSNYNVVIGTPAEQEARLRDLQRVFERHVPDRAESAMVEWRDNSLRGTASEIVERLAAMKDLGMTYAITYFPRATEDHEQAEQFAAEVIPALQ